MSSIYIDRSIFTLAFGYGLAQQAIRNSRIVAGILARLSHLASDLVLVVEEYGWVEFYNSDEDYDDHREHHKVYRKTLKQIVEKVVQNYGHGFDADSIDAVSDLAELYGDEDITVTIMTENDYANAKKEERRKSLESTASNFARECGHAVGTREFVQSAKEKIAEVDYASERWNDGECQMERWATCLHSGSRDAYFADNDYMNGKYGEERGRLSDVLVYMRENFPLLMLHIEQEEANSDA